MRKLFLVLALTVPLSAQERIDLTTPVTVNQCTLARLDLQWRDSIIYIELDSNAVIDGQPQKKTHTYTGQTARDLMIVLNKADLTVQSLQRRVMNRLIADKVITGTVSGVPQ